jgi:hypothetical protein
MIFLQEKGSINYYELTLLVLFFFIIINMGVRVSLHVSRLISHALKLTTM